MMDKSSLEISNTNINQTVKYPRPQSLNYLKSLNKEQLVYSNRIKSNDLFSDSLNEQANYLFDSYLKLDEQTEPEHVRNSIDAKQQKNSPKVNTNEQVLSRSTTTNNNDISTGDDDDDEDDDDSDETSQSLLFPGFVPIALKYLSQETKPRIWCLKMITSPWFERFSMFVIIVNCITLGMYQPCSDNHKCTSTRCHILEYLDHFIHIFFTIEMSIKILAMGFYGKETYMAETWNRLDFFIVIAG